MSQPIPPALMPIPIRQFQIIQQTLPQRRAEGLALVLVVVVVHREVGGTALVTGTGLWSWGSPELAAAFIAFGLVLALVGGLRPGAAADAFLEGMQGMLLAGLGLIVGLIGSVFGAFALASLLYGVRPIDLPVFLSVPVVLLAGGF